MLEVRQIVNEVFSSNTYVVLDESYNYCWLVDIGDFDKVTDVLPPGLEVRGVFLTHSHFDHIYGANRLHRAFPQCRIFTSSYGREAIYSDKKNFSLYHESSFVYEGDEVEVLSEGEKREIYPGEFITAYDTPGHCPSCLTYVIKDWIFTGDAYIPDVMVVTKLPGGDRVKAQHSLERIKELCKRRVVCAGHGELLRMK